MKVEIIISIYENENDEIGTAKSMFVEDTLTVKNLVSKLARKYKTSVKEFAFYEAINTSKTLERIAELDISFCDKNGTEYGVFLNK